MKQSCLTDRLPDDSHAFGDSLFFHPPFSQEALLAYLKPVHAALPRVPVDGYVL